MPIRIKATKEDILKGKVVDPGWYPLEVKGVEEALSKAGDSTNYNVEFKVLNGPFAEVVMYRTFNEKGKGFMTNFITALGWKIKSDGTWEVEDLEKAIGRKLDGYVKNELYNGVMRNRVDDFRPAASEAKVVNA